MTLAAQTVIVGIQYCFPFWLLPWSGEFHISQGRLMLVVSVSNLVSGAVSPVAGAVFDRYPVRAVFSLGVLGFALLFVVMSLANSYWVVLCCYGFLLPIASVLTTTLFAQITLARWFVSQRGLAMGISACGVSLGAFVLPPIATALLSRMDWHATFRVLGVAVTALIPIGLLVLRSPEHGSPPRPMLAAVVDETPVYTAAQVLREGDFWRIALGFGCILLACLPVQYGIGSYAADLGLSQRQAALAASLSAVGFAAGKLSFGKLADLIPHHLSYRIAVGFIVVGIVLCCTADSLLPLTVGLSLMTFGQGCTLPISAAMVASRFPMRSFGQVLGLLWMIVGLSSLSAYLAGLVRDASGSYPLAFTLLTIPLLGALYVLRDGIGAIRQPISGAGA
jgi:MFS family permease